jgi:hypothetical protein
VRYDGAQWSARKGKGVGIARLSGADSARRGRVEIRKWWMKRGKQGTGEGVGAREWGCTTACLRERREGGVAKAGGDWITRWSGRWRHRRRVAGCVR